jgi:hypothetical protein
MCDFNPLNLLARNRRHFNSRFLLAREPSFPAQNPQARSARHPPPPPQQLRQRRRGEGAGDWPGSPMHPEQVLLLSFPSHEWLHILIWHNTYAFYTERINEWKYNYITLGEGIICQEGVRSQSPPAPLKGMFCMNCDYRKSVGPPYWQG